MGDLEPFSASQCNACKRFAIWLKVQMVFPQGSAAPFPSGDMPDDIAKDFVEAREVHPISSRSSAALLRLAIQKLCKHLGLPGKDLNSDIGKLVERGLDSRTQKAMDIVRVIGNEAVHPGQIDLRDDPEMALKLFGLVNWIVHDMITRPRELEQQYGSLPQDKLEGIRQRDAKKDGQG